LKRRSGASGANGYLHARLLADFGGDPAQGQPAADQSHRARALRRLHGRGRRGSGKRRDVVDPVAYAVARVGRLAQQLQRTQERRFAQRQVHGARDVHLQHEVHLRLREQLDEHLTGVRAARFQRNQRLLPSEHHRFSCSCLR
jgi:hypothetical protein